MSAVRAWMTPWCLGWTRGCTRGRYRHTRAWDSMGAHGGAYTHSGFTPRVGLRVHPRVGLRVHPRVGLRAKVPNYTVLVVKVAKLHRFGRKSS